MIVRCNNLYCDALFLVLKSLSMAGGLPVDKLYFYTIGPARSCPYVLERSASFWGISQNCPFDRGKIAMDQNTQTSASRGKSRPSTTSATPTFEFPKFGIPNFEVPKMEIPAAYREFAEKNASQAKATYEKIKSAADEASDAL